MEYARIMTRYLCAPDSFKESLTAMQAAEAMARGIENADRDAEIRCLPMADGGEGTVRALVDATGGTMHAVPVHDPLGRLIEGRFGVLADGATAVVETAEASGLARLNAEERNPLIASSYGTGELLLAAAVLAFDESSSVSVAAPPMTPAPASCNPSACVSWTRTATSWDVGERPWPMYPSSTSQRWIRSLGTCPSSPPAM